MIKKILNNPLFNVLSYNGVIVLGRIITSFVVSKVSAIYLGPSGFAILGNFRNLLQAILGLTSSGFESGVIKHISEFKDNKKKYLQIVATIFALSTIISLLISPILFLYSESLCLYFLKDVSYVFIFKCLALVLPLLSYNLLLIYVINGLQKIKLYTWLSILLNIVSAIFTFILIYFYNLEGALLASLLIPIATLLLSVTFKEVRVIIFEHLLLFKNFSFKIAKSISIYLFMAIYSTILISATYVLIRNNIISNLNIESAGLWESMNKISTFYMIFFSSLMTLYLLPKLAENKTVIGYIGIIKSYFKMVLPIAFLAFLALLILKTFIIKLFLTNEFIIIQQFFHWQLLADFFKIIGFSLAYQFHAKRMVLPYFVTDAVLYGTFYLFTIPLMAKFNLLGVYYAYILSAMLYLLIVTSFIYFTRHKYLGAHE